MSTTQTTAAAGHVSTRPATAAGADGPVRIHADHDTARHLGNWTGARDYQVRARYSSVLIDLRSPQIPDGDIEVELDLDHATVRLLVGENTVIDQRDIRWAGRGRVKQTYHHNPAGTGRQIRLTGAVRQGEIRVSSGGIAQLTAICTREFLADARRAHAEGRAPLIDDPARTR
jgi:hypothetical protein